MKILCVLYDDPKDGMPTSYPVRHLPELEKYPDGMTWISAYPTKFIQEVLLGRKNWRGGFRDFGKI